MAQSSFVIKIEGLERMVKKLDGVVLLGKPLRNAFNRSVLLLEREVKQTTPVDTGRLRSSITHSLDSRPVPLFGKVGTNVAYARPVEFGSRPHWPPFSAMQPWAKRHGFPVGAQGAFLVARAIAQKGTKAHLMFTNAFKNNLGKVQSYFNDASREIERIWGAR